MRNSTNSKKSFGLLLTFLLWTGIAIGQDYDVTLPQQCNSGPSAGSAETITFPSTPASANSDATLIITYSGDLDGTGGNLEILDFIDEDGNSLGVTTSITQCSGVGTFQTTIPLATLLPWLADGQVDIIAQANANVAGTLCSGNGFCVTGTLQYGVSTADNDLGVASLDTPGTFFCSGTYNLVTTVQNYGTNLVNNYTVNWEWNGALQTPISVTTPLDTVNGTGPSSAQITLGSQSITGTNVLKVWTSSPNGVADTINANDTLNVILTPSIQSPTSLSVGNLGPVSADLGWTEIGSSSLWNVQYGPQGFTLGTGTDVFTSNNPYSLSGLTANTSYDFYVRSICSGGDTSAWSGPLSFTTTCTIFGTPFLENFDGPSWIPPFPGAIDQCWTVTTVSAPVWQAEDAQTGSGNTGPLGDVSGTGKYVYLETSGGSLGDTSDLISPVIDISGLTTPQAEFYYHMFGSAMGTLILEVDENGSWTTLWSLTGQQQTSSADPWVKVNVPFTTTDDTVRFRFRGVRGSSFTSDMSVDEFRVRQAPTCPDLLGLNVINVLPNSANVEWVSLGGGNNFQIEHGPAGFTLGTGTITATTDTFGTISGLASNTSYDWYVREICTPGDTSAWSIRNGFITPCSIFPNPYSESFDGPGWTLTFPLQIDQCWSRTPTTGFLWQPEDQTTGSFGTGPSGDVFGTGKYVYTEASSGTTGSVAELTSPLIDISNLTAPQVEFYYHMFGGQMGTLDVQVSDAGTWVSVFTITGQQQLSETDPWTKVNVPFTTSDDTVQIKFVGTRGSGLAGDMAIDELRVFQPIPEDFSAIAIDSIESGCGLTATETIGVRITNLGTATFNPGFSFPVSADVNGTVTTETVTLADTLAPGDTAAYVFSAPFDLSAFGSYVISIYPSLPGDSSNTNDTIIETITNIPIITNFPYFENFDSGPGGWIASGNTTWALGAPAGAIINSASSAPNAWVTGLTTQYNNSEDGVVTGPCLAFDSLIAPEVQVDVWWDSETSFDGMQMQTSLDGGATWQQVSFIGDPNSTNWYNGTFFGLSQAGASNEGWGGRFGSESGGWVTATADLSGLSGQPDALFRMQFGSDGSVQGEGVAFDNFRIIETALPFNVELLDIISPVSGCGLSATDTVILEYANIGLNTITTGTTLNFTYTVNGVPTTENLVLAADLLPGDTTTYTFAATVDLSVPATYAFGAIATFAADQNPLDDSLFADIVSIPVITSFPYFEDFEASNGGWTSGGSNNSWEYGTPAGTNINTASSGVNAWMTGLSTNYNNGEESFVLGPCFDFSTLVLPLIKVDVNWNSEFSWDGAQLQASTNAGATWQIIGAFGDPFNWYTDNTVNGLAFTGIQEGWTGTGTSGSNGWLTAQNDLTTFAGNSGVLMRMVFGSDGSVNGFDGFAFDNFHILESPNNDIAVDSLIGLQSGCGYTSTTPITMRVTNRGILPQSNIPVFYTVNGVASTTETIATTLNPGQTFVYTFTNTADLSTPQLYTITGHSALATDEDTTNDVSNAKIFTSLFTPEILSVTNGETCESGPVTMSVTSNGDTDQWFDVPSGGTALGTGASYTLPNVTQDDTLWVQTVMNATGCNSATASGRTPVFAFHSTTPIINFTSAVTGPFTVTFTSSLSSNVDSVLWDFGYGTASSTDPNPVHTFPGSQSYVVTLNAFSGSCAADTFKAVFVPVGGLNDNVYTNVSVFPNPSSGNFRLEADDVQGEVVIELVSMDGTTVHRENAVATRNKLIHDVVTEDLPGGTYLLKIKNDEILINGRIVIE